jgi:hypothetical protein
MAHHREHMHIFRGFLYMRILAVLMVCLALATCSSNAPRPQISTAATVELKNYPQLRLIALPARQQEAPAPAAITARLTSMLREGLSLRGYSEDPQAELLAYYWLELQITPFDINANMAPPAPLGPYQSVHRLHEERVTLRLRLTNEQNLLLWEGQIDTGLSPAWDSEQQLQRACDSLLQQLPRAS